MNKEIRKVSNGIVQVTTIDERHYARPSTDKVTGLPIYEFVPSVTWITEHYPKGIGFYKWLAQTGWDESQALKEAAGDKGSKVHTALSILLAGHSVSMDEPITNPSTGKPEPLTLEEYAAVMSFAAWHDAVTPTLVAQDIVVWNDTDHYAGTVDAVFRFANALWVIDFKTSKAVYPGHRMQVSAYREANPEWHDAKLGILQLGYARNQTGYKFTEVEGCYELFLAAKKIWHEETKGQSPLQRDYPLSLTLAPAAPPVPSERPGADAGQGATSGGNNGEVRRGTEADGLRKSGSGRMVAGNSRGSAVRRAPSVQVQK